MDPAFPPTLRTAGVRPREPWARRLVRMEERQADHGRGGRFHGGQSRPADPLSKRPRPFRQARPINDDFLVRNPDIYTGSPSHALKLRGWSAAISIGRAAAAL